MKIGTHGILMNERGHVLLIQRDDTRTFAPPGGGLEAAELPPDNATREMREETGLIVLPIRLVGVYYLGGQGQDWMSFSFRCLLRGGTITTSSESLQVGYHDLQHLPIMAGFHEERVRRGATHPGGAPYWGRQEMAWRDRVMRTLLFKVIYPAKNLRRTLLKEPAYQPPPDWRSWAFGVLRNAQGDVLWVKHTSPDCWMLPGGQSWVGEAPWETAVRLIPQQTGLTARLLNLPLVTIYRQEPRLDLVFTTEIATNHWPAGPQFLTLPPGQAPENVAPGHAAYAAQACTPQDTTQFQFNE